MKEKLKDISILDCTLRDGSYSIDYQFTIEDTYLICLGLMRAGFTFIEVGHGTGLRSSKAGKGKSCATDEEYLKAAKTALAGSNAKFGMFFIPGIGKMEDLTMAASYGMNFVRVGTNITEVEQAKPYIEAAKNLGMQVSSNLMKSYAVPIDEFVHRAKMADDFGADVITIVDSAGGMFPHDVREYVSRLKEVTEKRVGFHGHNNLQLAIANTLEAIHAGASVVDSSLQGMGRSAGNAQTEVLVTVLEKLGYNTGVDLFKTMDIGKRLIRPSMNRDQGVDDMSLVSGIAQFHSSFLKVINDAAQKYGIDPRLLIMEVSEIDRVTVTPELAEKTALWIREQSQHGEVTAPSVAIDVRAITDRDVKNSSDHARVLAKEITSQSKKSGKESVFTITLGRDGRTVFPFIRQNASFVIGNVEASDISEIERLVEALDGEVSWLLLDESSLLLRESGLQEKIRKSGFTWYSEERALRSSIWALLSQKRAEGKVLLLSDKENSDILRLSLQGVGVPVVTANDLYDDKKNGLVFETSDNDESARFFKEIGTIVSLGREYAHFLSGEHVVYLSDSTRIYALRPSAFAGPFWKGVIERGLPVYRVDTRVAFAAELSLVIETTKMVTTMGSAELAGANVVAGGAIGSRGSIVVDSILAPRRVIGIADGMGGVLPPEEEEQYRAVREKIQAELFKRIL